MGRFLFAVWPFNGHIYPNVAIARALRGRRHEVAFYTGSRTRPIVEEEGFAYFPFRRVDEGDVDRIWFSQHRCLSWKRPFQLGVALRALLIDTVPGQVGDLEAVMATWQPDLLVCDMTMWGPILVLQETCNVPVAVSSSAAGCMIPGLETPPQGFGLPVPRVWHTRLLARLVKATTDLATSGFRRDVGRLRRRYGLMPLSTSVQEFMGRMPLYLVRGDPKFDYERRDLPASVNYVGPLVWNKGSNKQLPSWLFQRKDQPLVHVTEGTMQTGEPLLLRTAAQGLAKLGVQVVITTGETRDPRELRLGPISPNVKVERWISHSELLRFFDVVVTVGGAGTVLSALAAGVPLVIVPAETDQPDNARRVVEAGAGLSLVRWRCTPGRLREAVEHVLQEPSFRQNAQRIATAFSRYGGAARAAVLLENLSKKGGRRIA